MTGVGRLRESNHKESLPNRILDTSTLVELFCEQFRYVKLHVVNMNVVLAYPCSEVHTVSYSADSDHRDPRQCMKWSLYVQGLKKTAKLQNCQTKKWSPRQISPFVNGRCLESVSIKKKEDRNSGSNPDL